MVDPDNLLRKIDEKLDLVIADVRDLQSRMTAIEHTIAGLADAVAGHSCRDRRRSPPS